METDLQLWLKGSRAVGIRSWATVIGEENTCCFIYNKLFSQDRVEFNLFAHLQPASKIPDPRTCSINPAHAASHFILGCSGRDEV